jgi:hypothetical protein
MKQKIEFLVLENAIAILDSFKTHLKLAQHAILLAIHVQIFHNASLANLVHLKSGIVANFVPAIQLTILIQLQISVNHATINASNALLQTRLIAQVALLVVLEHILVVLAIAIPIIMIMVSAFVLDAIILARHVLLVPIIHA